ncbi:ADP-ribosylglycohydrolase family protein [Flavimaricola marinus]|uniref:ADP-ribosylglycohydrolase n=1 Tax=Flavimaricola marinus TaxID=1819565 RepID=A0A238LJZ2_9RHOB|nr:ADP-ribosylglycohydrolase family protein [Flavimaricola marinus]SMY09991.1 ADP-ribosylglycohydrolase [Flavimaricola marinus]
MTPETLRAKIYAGLLGKTAGVRLGAPVEPTAWDHDLIRATYGEITGYVRDYQNFAADDDTNGPYYFVRTLFDELEFTAEAAGRTWLDYIPDGHGMLWWGGFGISTEQTAFENLQNGIVPPRSGSIAQNGLISAEQIGGQIFSDCWGWVNPGDPAEAARMARIMGSVSHDGEALEGAAYVAAANAVAFDTADIQAVHRMARAYVTDGTAYAAVIDAVAAFHASEPDDWRACFAMLEADFGYDKWTGVCHVIPNAGVVVLALLYGRGDMPRTIEIATMCGWDTDCNAGNAGSIAGIAQGVQRSWDKYRGPINDILIASGVTGAANIVDLPSFARDLTVLALRDRPFDIPAYWVSAVALRGVDFDFTLPGATHGLRAAGSHRLRTLPGLTDGALTVQVDRWAGTNGSKPGDTGRVFWKPFYREADFDDNRYRPMLSPIVAAGQTATFTLRGGAAIEGPRTVQFVPYVRHAMTGKVTELGTWTDLPEDWQEVSFTLPESDEAIDEIGLMLRQMDPTRVLMRFEIKRLRIEGPGQTRIVPALEAPEWGAVSRFSFNRGTWTVQDTITGSAQTDADLWTGHPYATDQTVSATLESRSGDSHLVTARVRTACRFYAAGIEGGRAVILCEDHGTQILAEAPLPDDIAEKTTLSLTAKGDKLSLTIDGVAILEAIDNRHPRGMAGLRLGGPGRMSCSAFSIEEH